MSDIGKNNPIQKFNHNDPRYLKTNETEIARQKNKANETHFLHDKKPVKKASFFLLK